MPANHIENTPEADDAPKVAPAAATAARGFKAWIPLLITILLMPALAYAVTTFVLLPRLQKGLGITVAARGLDGSKGGKKDANTKKESHTMNKLLVNVAGTMGARYLLVSLSVVGTDPEFKGKMQEHDPQLRDMAQGALATKTLAELEKPGARNLIRSELISGFNNILGDSVVEEIYLTEFAIQ